MFATQQLNGSGARPIFATSANAWRLTPGAAAVALAISSGNALAAAPADGREITLADTSFDGSFLVGNSVKGIDLSRFERQNATLPGKYSIDIAVGGGWRGRRQVTFAAAPGRADAVPCYDRALFSEMGLDWRKLPHPSADGGQAVDLEALLANGPVCRDLSELIPPASQDYDASEQLLSISIPQIYLNRFARGWVDPSEWDSGVTAGMLSYSFNGYDARSYGSNYRSAYLGINAGVDVAGWRLRHSGSFQWSSSNSRHYAPSATYAEHDLQAFRAQMRFGDVFTDGSVFDGGVRIRGAQITSDDRMLPRSQRGFAPVVRGVAETNAQVTVRQNGLVVLQTTVPPGPFQIDDIFPSGSSGDLVVTIQESDGRQKIFTVPFASLPQLLRPGMWRYAFTAGQVDDVQQSGHARIAQGTVQRGLTNWVTAYGGVTATSGYWAVLAGLGLNTPIGAFNADVTRARTDLPGSGAQTGQSLRIGYSRTFDELGTTVAVSAYRYSSAGYLSLGDALQQLSATRSVGSSVFLQQKNRFDVTISQTLGSYGQVSLTGSSLRYWHGGGDTTYSASYSNAFHEISYSISAIRTRNLAQVLGGGNATPGAVADSRTSTLVMLSVSVPLGSGRHRPLVSSSVTHDSTSGTSLQSSLTGNAGEHSQYSYGVSTGLTRGDSSSHNIAANAGYDGTSVALRATGSHGTSTDQVGLGLSGAAVVHRGGVTLARRLDDTIAIVHAPGAGGAVLGGSANNVVVDARGYAIVPYMTPYERNTVTLDPAGLPLDVELKDGIQSVAPRAGAAVWLDFGTNVGKTALIEAKRAGGAPLPFGAAVEDEGGQAVGTVGQGGIIIARGLKPNGTLTVSWGQGTAGACTIRYQLPVAPAPKTGARAGYTRLTAVCEGGTSRAGGQLPSTSGAPAYEGADR